jgi:hypothetical protein
MAAGSTYTPIATTTLGSATASYTFSSIPSTYTDLILIGSVAANGGNDDVKINFNGDTSTNLSATFLYGNGTSAASARRTSVTDTELDWTGIGSNQGRIAVNIMNYANTTTYKTALSRVDFSDKGANASVVLWRSTAAITSVKLSLPGQLFIVGSTFTLYGIAAA